MGSFMHNAQRETFPDNVFASTSQGQLHELVLKATQENGQANAVPGFKVDLTNVVSTPANPDIALFTTDNALSIVGAKVKTANTDTFIDLSKKNTNVFSFAGVPTGVYTLDVIVQKQNSKAAYEGIVVIGQTVVNEATKQIVQKEIVKQETDVRIDFEDNNNNNGNDNNERDNNNQDKPYCDQVPDDYKGSCWDRKDYDEITGLYPCKDGSQVKDWKDCIEDKDEQGCDENDDYCDLDQGCQRPDIDCIDDVNIESGDSRETATGERAYNPNGQQTCGNEETGEEWPCGPDEEEGDEEDSTNVEEESGGEMVEEESANCGGEPCTPTEKDDSWLDEDEGEEAVEGEDTTFESGDDENGDGEMEMKVEMKKLETMVEMEKAKADNKKTKLTNKAAIRNYYFLSNPLK